MSDTRTDVGALLDEGVWNGRQKLLANPSAADLNGSPTHAES